MENDIIPAIVASEYERLDGAFREYSGIAVAKTMEAWYALYEIYSKQLWRARFDRREEWLRYIGEMGIPGMGTSTVQEKLKSISGLIENGTTKEIAAAAVAAAPIASQILAKPGSMKQAAKGQSPNDYVAELLTLTPSEAVKRVRADSGHSVEMWLHDWVLVNPNKVATVLVREDSGGYTSYDVTLEVKPQIPANQGRIPDLFVWLKKRIKAKG